METVRQNADRELVWETIRCVSGEPWVGGVLQALDRMWDAEDEAYSSMLLDAANAAREVACVAALALIQADGDAEDALHILDVVAMEVPSEKLCELDAASIAGQGIRSAISLRDAG